MTFPLQYAIAGGSWIGGAFVGRGCTVALVGGVYEITLESPIAEGDAVPLAVALDGADVDQIRIGFSRVSATRYDLRCSTQPGETFTILPVAFGFFPL